MIQPQDTLRRTWHQGGAALGAFLFLRDDLVAVEAIGGMGLDYVCVDLQHGTAGDAEMLSIVQVLSCAGGVPLVRARANDAAAIGKALDAGAHGVIVPLVESVEQAAAAVAACRYPPVGRRSYGPLRADIAYGSEYRSNADRHVLCIPMIETAAGVDAVEQIARVPGVDALYVGPSDLCVSYGISPVLDSDDERFQAALRRVVQACRLAGITAGIHACSELAARRLGEGFAMVTVTNDLGALLTGLNTDLRLARRHLSQFAGRAS